MILSLPEIYHPERKVFLLDILEITFLKKNPID
jgi:hypothetical protein